MTIAKSRLLGGLATACEPTLSFRSMSFPTIQQARATMSKLLGARKPNTSGYTLKIVAHPVESGQSDRRFLPQPNMASCVLYPLRWAIVAQSHAGFHVSPQILREVWMREDSLHPFTMLQWVPLERSRAINGFYRPRGTGKQKIARFLPSLGRWHIDKLHMMDDDRYHENVLANLPTCFCHG